MKEGGKEGRGKRRREKEGRGRRVGGKAGRREGRGE